MKTLLILGIGIWGFLAIVNYYGKPTGGAPTRRPDLKDRDNSYEDYSGKKSKVSGMNKPQYS